MALPTMAAEILLLHNPRCSKSREAKALLEDRGIVFSTRFYLEDPLSADELRALQSRLGRPILEWTRTKEEAFAQAGLSTASSDEAVRAAMVRFPILMERPIVITAVRAVVGRPAMKLLGLLDD